MKFIKQFQISKQLYSSLTHSNAWISRQSKDIYVQQRISQNYRSRASFKLLEIQKKYKILSKDSRCLDLGCAPGGWSQVALSFVKSNGIVIGVDLQDMIPLPGLEFIQGDIESQEIQSLIQEKLKGQPPTVILSDMHPGSKGNPSIDVPKSHELALLALQLCIQTKECIGLQKDGHLVVKYLQGQDEAELKQKFSLYFKNIHHFKPQSSRKESREGFLICKFFKG